MQCTCTDMLHACPAVVRLTPHHPRPAASIASPERIARQVVRKDHLQPRLQPRHVAGNSEKSVSAARRTRPGQHLRERFTLYSCMPRDLEENDRQHMIATTARRPFSRGSSTDGVVPSANKKAACNLPREGRQQDRAAGEQRTRDSRNATSQQVGGARKSKEEQGRARKSKEEQAE